MHFILPSCPHTPAQNHSFHTRVQVMIAGVMPIPLFTAVTASVVVAVGMSLARLTGSIPAEGQNGRGMGLWRSWQLIAGVGGLSMVAQVHLWACVCSWFWVPVHTVYGFCTGALVGVCMFMVLGACSYCPWFLHRCVCGCGCSAWMSSTPFAM